MTDARIALAELVVAQDNFSFAQMTMQNVPKARERVERAWIAARAMLAAPAQGEPRHLTRDEQQMLGRALRASAREVPAQGEPQVPEMVECPWCKSIFAAAPPAVSPTIGANQCEHGSLRRKCEICERDDAIAALRADLDGMSRNADFLQAQINTQRKRAERAEAERDEAHSAVDAWIDLLRATETERENLRECVRAENERQAREIAKLMADGAGWVQRAERAEAERDALRETCRINMERITACANECEKLRADAERYRWLRDTGDHTWTPLLERCNRGHTAEEIDANIDAARAKVQP